LCVLAGLAEKMGALLAYGITLTIGLLYRDYYSDQKDYILYFFELFLFWVACVPVWFEARYYFPIVFISTALYGMIIVLFGSFHNANVYWKKSQYALHFFDFATKGFALGFVLPLVGFGVWLLLTYGYQYFSTLIGRFISF
jgi:hypothetical protein